MTHSTRLIDNLRRVEIFAGLTDDDLSKVASVCKGMRAAAGRAVFNEGDDGDEFYVVHEGAVRVIIATRAPDGQISRSTINTLYPGQCFGEGALVSGSLRSASVEAIEPTTLIVISTADFHGLCERDPRIGYRVLHNLAQDLSYKLNSSNLLLRGNIKWRDDELSPIE